MRELVTMPLGQIFGGVAGFLAFLSIFIEISPIKFNPISSFLKWFGRKTNQELQDEITEIKSEVAGLQDKVQKIEDTDDERNAILCRVRILRFGDEVRRGIKQSQESFDQVLSDMDVYDHYCDKHPNFRNNKTVVTQKKIRDAYASALEKNEFL